MYSPSKARSLTSITNGATLLSFTPPTECLWIHQQAAKGDFHAASWVTFTLTSDSRRAQNSNVCVVANFREVRNESIWRITSTTTTTRRRRTRTHSPWNIYSFFHRRTADETLSLGIGIQKRYRL